MLLWEFPANFIINFMQRINIKDVDVSTMVEHSKIYNLPRKLE